MKITIEFETMGVFDEPSWAEDFLSRECSIETQRLISRLNREGFAIREHSVLVNGIDLAIKLPEEFKKNGRIVWEGMSGIDTYIALFTSPIDDDGGGDEVSGHWYERQKIEMGYVNGCLRNTSVATFDRVTGKTIGVAHVALYDAKVDGNMLFYTELSLPRHQGAMYIAAGDVFSMQQGNLQIDLI